MLDSHVRPSASAWAAYESVLEAGRLFRERAAAVGLPPRIVDDVHDRGLWHLLGAEGRALDRLAAGARYLDDYPDDDNGWAWFQAWLLVLELALDLEPAVRDALYPIGGKPIRQRRQPEHDPRIPRLVLSRKGTANNGQARNTNE